MIRRLGFGLGPIYGNRTVERVNDPARELHEPPATAADLERSHKYPGAGYDAEGGERSLLSRNHLAWLLLGTLRWWHEVQVLM